MEAHLERTTFLKRRPLGPGWRGPVGREGDLLPCKRSSDWTNRRPRPCCCSAGSSPRALGGGGGSRGSSGPGGRMDSRDSPGNGQEIGAVGMEERQRGPECPGSRKRGARGRKQSRGRRPVFKRRKPVLCARGKKTPKKEKLQTPQSANAFWSRGLRRERCHAGAGGGGQQGSEQGQPAVPASRWFSLRPASGPANTDRTRP